MPATRAMFLTVLLVSLAGCSRAATLPKCAVHLGVKSFKEILVLMVADPGAFSGSAEAAYYLSNLVNKTEVADVAPACAHVYTGMLLQQKVAVVTSGIDSLNAALCTQQLLECNAYISAMIYSGTSGWSPAPGGILNADMETNTCEGLNNNTGAGDTIRLGDVCISPMSINWDCRQASWSQQARGSPNICNMPTYSAGPLASYLYGECLYTDVLPVSLRLTNEIVAATKTALWRANSPFRSNATYMQDVSYWNSMSNGLGQQYTLAAQQAPPSVFDYTVCSEIDSQFFYSGVPWEMEARSFVATLLDQSPLTSGKNHTKKDVLAVAAMEAIGFMQALNQNNDGAKFPYYVAYTNVRASSNKLHPPVVKLANGTYGYGPYEEDFNTGYSFAIASVSNTVLTTLQIRCLKMHPAAMCTFKLN